MDLLSIMSKKTQFSGSFSHVEKKNMELKCFCYHTKNKLLNLEIQLLTSMVKVMICKFHKIFYRSNAPFKFESCMLKFSTLHILNKLCYGNLFFFCGYAMKLFPILLPPHIFVKFYTRK